MLEERDPWANPCRQGASAGRRLPIVNAIYNATVARVRDLPAMLVGFAGVAEAKSAYSMGTAAPIVGEGASVDQRSKSFTALVAPGFIPLNFGRAASGATNSFRHAS